MGNLWHSFSESPPTQLLYHPLQHNYSILYPIWKSALWSINIIFINLNYWFWFIYNMYAEKFDYDKRLYESVFPILDLELR